MDIYNNSIAAGVESAVAALLKTLPSRRMRDVIEKRFGLKKGVRMTLEAIGTEYKITRERVRQIEADVLMHVRKNIELPEVQAVLASLREQCAVRGGVVAEHNFLEGMAPARFHPSIILLMTIGTMFHLAGESDAYHRRWGIDKETAVKADRVMQMVVTALKERGSPVSREELQALVAENARFVFGAAVSEQALDTYSATSKRIGKNPYGEFGLIEWASINPAGVKDKAYHALAKKGAPLHFREVADAITRAAWSKKKAHPQTVHNELIKDPRFVLVGRGVYALGEWGYERGAVRDVMTSVLKASGRALTKDELVEGVLAKRMVKVPTILLNLQDKKRFKKTEEGTYTFV